MTVARFFLFSPWLHGQNFSFFFFEKPLKGRRKSSAESLLAGPGERAEFCPAAFSEPVRDPQRLIIWLMICLFFRLVPTALIYSFTASWKAGWILINAVPCAPSQRCGRMAVVRYQQISSVTECKLTWKICSPACREYFKRILTDGNLAANLHRTFTNHQPMNIIIYVAQWRTTRQLSSALLCGWSAAPMSENLSSHWLFFLHIYGLPPSARLSW